MQARPRSPFTVIACLAALLLGPAGLCSMPCCAEPGPTPRVAELRPCCPAKKPASKQVASRCAECKPKVPNTSTPAGLSIAGSSWVVLPAIAAVVPGPRIGFRPVRATAPPWDPLVPLRSIRLQV